MFWVDYTVEQGLNRFRVTGDWDKEVMGYDKDGNPGCKERPLYSPGEVYVVGEDGWLHKTDELSTMVLKYENSKTTSTKSLEK